MNDRPLMINIEILAELKLGLERIISQQRRMSYFLILLQEETGRDERLESLESEIKQMEDSMENLSHRVEQLEALAGNPGTTVE